MTIRDITPSHLRCGSGFCPSVKVRDDGRLEITGEYIRMISKPDAVEEAVIVISQEYFSDLPELVNARKRIAELEAILDESAIEVKTFSPEALVKMREYAKNADVLNAQRMVDLGCQAGAEPEEAAHRALRSSIDCCGDALLTLHIERGQAGLYYVTGSQVGLLVAGHTLLDALAGVPIALEELQQVQRPDEEPCKGDTASQPVGQ